MPFGVITAVLYPIAFHPFILVQYITEVGLQNSAENAASFYFIQRNEKEKYETEVEELFDQNSIFFHVSSTGHLLWYLLYF